MKIIRKIWSHLSFNNEQKYFNTDIRESDPYEVNSFRDLVKLIAKVSYHNPEWSLFYRGQDNDYKNKLGQTSVYPSIYRSQNKLIINKSLLQEKDSLLKRAEYELLNAHKNSAFRGDRKLNKFKELRWSILQHYEICDTPLLDITHSLRVACSFALNSKNEYGILLVFGLPHIHGSISYFVEEELFNIKLLSICSPEAYRPYFQEGYMVGTFPYDQTQRSLKLDMGRRLVAKFKLKKKNFWNNHFTAIPTEALFPEPDPMMKKSNLIKEKINNGF